jgi:hypothetical protein
MRMNLFKKKIQIILSSTKFLKIKFTISAFNIKYMIKSKLDLMKLPTPHLEVQEHLNWKQEGDHKICLIAIHLLDKWE